MGSPQVASEYLQILLGNNLNIVGVYTQPPRPKGRGMNIQNSPVHNEALKQKIPVFHPENFKDNENIELFKELIVMEEGCLSLPKQFANIERPQSVTVSYLNESNKVVEEKKEGLEARILQHEIDHLYGKLFVDYLSSLKRSILIKKVKKLKKMGEI